MKLNAAVQVDLDGIWTIYRYHGIEQDIWPDPVFTEAVPRFLSLFDEMQIRVTFFIVGIDNTVPEKTKLIQQIAKAGHEIANHSYSHPIPFNKLNDIEMENEISRTNIVLEETTGTKPVGFRAPAYGIDERTIKLLERLQFQYDASVFPTRWAKILEMIEKKKSGNYQPLGNYGGNHFSNAPLKPYRMDMNQLNRIGTSSLMEIPVSVIPFIRTPMHRSVSQFLGHGYFGAGVRLNKICKNPLSVLFHGVDLVDSFQDDKLPRLKWVTSPFPQRIDELRRMIKLIKKYYNIVPTCKLIPLQN